ncbi:hypothetical protein BDV29DRAFT_159681 [Aspergillus leporis]|uniref:Transcription factor domain-containing protein n=1 Tax=Aspergillus leporis TaxID=41062 RepID=A0A5N5WRZ7_9EURO|nr:hypothetical protein BDV29DRAFT_159681 [Aspergillus leporis]
MHALCQVRAELPGLSEAVQILWPLVSCQDHDAANLIYILKNPSSRKVFPLNSHGNFYHYIPSRLGHNHALDSAISCLCIVYADSPAGQGVISERARQENTKSLRALRLCLDDPKCYFQSETICASIVLKLCELLTNADNGRWNQLSHGTKTLIQNSDVVRFRQPFERAMLESQRAFFIMQDMNSRQPCFLAQSPWREFLREPGETPSTTRAITLRSKLGDWLVDVPAQWRLSGTAGKTFRSADEQGEYEAPLRSPPEHHSPPEYPHLLLGVLDCVVNSTLILLEDIMSTFASQPPQPDEPCSTIDYTITTQNRQQTIQFALDYVRRCSTVAAKPLEFGLQQLWSFRANQGKYIKSTVDQKNEVR